MYLNEKKDVVVRGRLNVGKEIYVTEYFVNDISDGVVLNFKKDFIEVWDREKIRQEIKILSEKISFSQNEEEKRKLEDSLSYLSAISVSGYRKLYRVKNSIYFLAKVGIIDNYSLRNGLIFEGRNNHLRIWNPVSYQIYKEKKENELLKEKFHKKIMMRKRNINE